jgi:RNA polymerase sigma-70 factor, ECF subfamily
MLLLMTSGAMYPEVQAKSITRLPGCTEGFVAQGGVRTHTPYNFFFQSEKARTKVVVAGVILSVNASKPIFQRSTAATMSQRSSEDLVCDAKSGDRQAFEELYHRYYPTVVRRLTHLTGPSAPVMDLVQETFLSAYQNLSRFRGEAPFGHWVLRIATNIARNHYRQGHRCLWRLWAKPEEQEKVAASLHAVDERYPHIQAVHQALDRLSLSHREAVILFELEGLSLSELAAALEIPLHAAASRVRRGRCALRRTLARMGFAPLLEVMAFCPGDPP